MKYVDASELCQRFGKDFCVDWVDGGLSEKVDILSGLKVGEGLFALSVKNTLYTDHMQNYIFKLRELGLDVGRGDCKYGYRMPLPKKDDTLRSLVIFRRF